MRATEILMNVSQKNSSRILGLGMCQKKPNHMRQHTAATGQ